MSRVKRNDVNSFIKKYGKTPEELESELVSNKISRTAYAERNGYHRTSLIRHFEMFNVKGFEQPKKEILTYICSKCGIPFERYVSPSQRSKKEYTTYCSLDCYHEILRKLDEREVNFNFNVETYQFLQASKSLGDYSMLELSTRHFTTISQNKVNHSFFKKGMVNEETAYIFGLWLSDGHVAMTRNGKSLKELEVITNKQGNKIICSYISRLQLTDLDIIDKVASIVNFKNKIINSIGTLNGKKTKQTKIIHINSPYFYNDLVALGCGINKTYYATYPLISDSLDKHFIRGVLDGDGSFYLSKEGNLYLKFCGNDLLMYGIYLKIKQHINVIPVDIDYPYDTGMKSFCQIRYGQKEAIKIRDWLYEDATIFGERKHEKAYSYEPAMIFQTISTSELADKLETSIYFIQENVYKYSLPHIKVGNLCCFKEEHIATWEDFLKERLKVPNSRFKNKEKLKSKWKIE